jgi:Ca2+-binding EF-hand superfamily protein
MRTRNLAIASIVALALAGGCLPALAQTTTQPMDTNRDGKATSKERRDTNQDGTVSKSEKVQARARNLEKFNAADKNKDGGLSREEARRGGFAGIEKNFDAMDTNKDGKVTREERRAFAKKQRAARKAAQSRVK